MHNIHDSNLDFHNFHHVDMNLYPLFIAIYEQHHISKAAQLLYMTQSTASHALQRLRQQLKDDLFIRVGNKMLPTPFAEQIYPDIQHALHSIQKITDSHLKKNFDIHTLKIIKIAVHDEIEPIIVPKVVQHFRAFNVELQFFSLKLERKNVVQDLISQQIDLVVDLEQDYGEKLQYQRLLQDHYVVCTQQKSVGLEDYCQAPHIGVSSRRTGMLLEDFYMHSHHQIQRKIFLRCQHYSTALQVLAEYPEAMLTMPKSLLLNLLVLDLIQIFDHPIDLPKLNMALYWSLNLSSNLRLNFLKKEIISIFT